MDKAVKVVEKCRAALWVGTALYGNDLQDVIDVIQALIKTPAVKDADTLKAVEKDGLRDGKKA